MIPKTIKKRNLIKGEYYRFIKSHQFNGKCNANWKGGQCYRDGRLLVKCPEHPKADRHGYVREYILIAEKALGKYLPPKSIVHHANEDPADNSSLVICNDIAYHALIHQRTRAFKACGNPHYIHCYHCDGWFDPSVMTKHRKGCKNLCKPCEKELGHYYYIKNKNGGGASHKGRPKKEELCLNLCP